MLHNMARDLQLDCISNYIKFLEFLLSTFVCNGIALKMAIYYMELGFHYMELDLLFPFDDCWASCYAD